MELETVNLIDDYLDGELDEARADQLRLWLEASPSNVREFVSQVFLHRQLRDGLLADSVTKSLEACGESEGATLLTCLGSFGTWSDGLRSYAPLMAVLLLGAIVGSAVTWRVAARWMADERSIVATSEPGATGGRIGNSQTATLVTVTNCRWDQAHSTADLTRGSVVRSGESLHLLEGVAEIHSEQSNGGTANLQLEGPLAMTLDSQGMPSLLYGHLTGSFACDKARFTLDTPLGRVSVSGDASIGIIAAPNKVELHVFSGAATLELWAMGFDAAKKLTAVEGSSVSARVNSDGSVSVDHGKSKESGFMTPTALTASRLRISSEYVKTILAAKPVAYWRFEGDVNGVMRNEMGDRFHCRMVGDAVRWHSDGENGSAEFGMTAGPGYLISDDVLDGVIDNNYSLETWVKPTYYHQGALLSLIQWSPTESPLDRHRLHLELCGPSPGVPSSILRSSEFHPGRIRFIHQTTACYSSSPYRVRAWQHIAAVRDGSAMRLYADGKVVATAEDATPLGNGLRVLMGQLFPQNEFVKDEVTSRLFVGDLDEVALYDRPLGADEIRKHVQLAAPRSDTSATEVNSELP